ncbi:protein RKD5-like [Trifolium pratense]|uniref:protein RKD5-like n=1 Tax=Trifolium pratense TaxID=57577 RepID=UPI001E69431D|nr:protein RKD5-like [Trifolium pratense]
MEEDSLKIALEVLEELKMGKNEIGRGDSKVVVANSSMVEVMGGVLNNGQSIKKKKNNIEVKDIYPLKYPICPKCKGEFFTFSAVIEHLLKNPNCASCGTSNPHQLVDLNKGADEVQQMEIEGSSNAAAAPKPAECFVGKKKRATRDHVAKITVSDLVKYFDMPLLEASKKLNVGTTVLKRRCRELGLPRWPHRKIKSLDTLIHDLQEEAAHKEMKNKAAAMAVRKKQKMVESEKERIEKKPFIAIKSETRRLRQYVFKRRYHARVMEKQN